MENFVKQEHLDGLPVINPHTAGIDVGSMLMSVAFTDREGQEWVFETNGFTHKLEFIVDKLQGEGVTDVAMEATGVYWMTLYDLLEDAGIKVTLINPGHYKNAAIQKTDIKECQWIHRYHACGIFRNSHIATDLFRELRGYVHERNIIQRQKSDVLNRIHRILTQMNVKVQHFISDIEGVGGMKLLRAMAGGETDSRQLLSLLDLERFKSSPEDLEDSLKGIYKECFINLLKLKLDEYDFLKSQMLQYEKYIETVLQKILQGEIPQKSEKKGEKGKKGKYVRKNEYHFDAKSYLTLILGTDLTAVEGLGEKVLLEILAVTGNDMSKWPTSQHFASYLGLAPRIRKSGGKNLGHDRKTNSNPASQAFRQAAHSIARSKSPLGQLYRTLAVRKGTRTAKKAVARKLSVLFYTLVKNKQSYDNSKIIEQEKKKQQNTIAKLNKLADKLGYTIQRKCA
jgi:transposase